MKSPIPLIAILLLSISTIILFIPSSCEYPSRPISKVDSVLNRDTSVHIVGYSTGKQSGFPDYEDSFKNQKNINQILRSQLGAIAIKPKLRNLSALRVTAPQEAEENEYVSIDQVDANIVALTDSLNKQELLVAELQKKLANSVQYPFHLDFNHGQIICLVESATKRGIVHMVIPQVGTRPSTIYQDTRPDGVTRIYGGPTLDTSKRFIRPALAPKSILDRHH